MIVICDRCQTRFKLDESRIPPGGARVRCSRCKHAFFLPAPGGDEPDLLDELISQTAAEPLRAPPPSEDLPELSSPELPQVEPEAPDAGKAPADAADSEWEFSDDVPRGEEALEPEDPDARGIPLDHAPVPELAEDPSLGSSGLELDDDRSAVVGPAGGPEQEPSGLTEIPAPRETAPADAEMAPAPEPAFAPPGESEGDLNWDFDDDDPVDAEPSGAAAPPTPTPIARIGLVKRGALESPVEPAAPPELLEPPEKLGKLLGAAGWLATSIFAGLVAVQLLLPARAAVGPRSPQPVGPWVAEEVQGSFVDNLFVGPLLVASVELGNPGDEPAALGSTLRVFLVDAEGRRLSGAQATLASASERELRELPPGVLAARLALRGRGLAERVLAPGERLRLTGVFPSVPQRASDLSLDLGPPVPTAALPVDELPPSASPEPGAPLADAEPAASP